MSRAWFPFFDEQDWDDFLDDMIGNGRESAKQKPLEALSDNTVLMYTRCPECDSFVGYCIWSEGMDFPPCFLEARGGRGSGSNK